MPPFPFVSGSSHRHNLASRCRDPSASRVWGTLLELIQPGKPGSGEAWQAEKHSENHLLGTQYTSTIDMDITQQRQSSVASHGSHRVSCPQYRVRSAEDMATGNLSSLSWNPQLTKHMQSPLSAKIPHPLLP